MIFFDAVPRGLARSSVAARLSSLRTWMVILPSVPRVPYSTELTDKKMIYVSGSRGSLGRSGTHGTRRDQKGISSQLRPSRQSKCIDTVFYDRTGKLFRPS